MERSRDELAMARGVPNKISRDSFPLPKLFVDCTMRYRREGWHFLWQYLVLWNPEKTADLDRNESDEPLLICSDSTMGRHITTPRDASFVLNARYGVKTGGDAYRGLVALLMTKVL